MSSEDPQIGQVWKWLLVWATITKVGPKQIEFRTGRGDKPLRIPRERFLSRFHKTGMGG